MKDQINKIIDQLREQLTGDMFADMDTRQEIQKLEWQRDGVVPSCNMDEGCENCGS